MRIKTYASAVAMLALMAAPALAGGMPQGNDPITFSTNGAEWEALPTIGGQTSSISASGGLTFGTGGHSSGVSGGSTSGNASSSGSVTFTANGSGASGGYSNTVNSNASNSGISVGNGVAVNGSIASAGGVEGLTGEFSGFSFSTNGQGKPNY